MSESTFIFQGKNYPTPGDAQLFLVHCESLETSMQFLNELKAKYPIHAISNLRYIMGQDPYYWVFSKFHKYNEKIKAREEEIKFYYSQITADFMNSVWGNK